MLDGNKNTDLEEKLVTISLIDTCSKNHILILKKENNFFCIDGIVHEPELCRKMSLKVQSYIS